LAQLIAGVADRLLTQGEGPAVARVLVVEDDGDVRDLVVRRVRAEGHRVIAAADGRTALAAVAAHGAPDAALLDVGLPDMDGVTLLARLREGCPGLPAVFVTVAWSGAALRRIKATGAGHVPKPFGAAALRDALLRVFSEDSGDAAAEGR
jgi:two-component system, OmpR family, response regulator